MRPGRAIAKRHGQPAYVNPPPLRKGDMASWYPGKTVKPGIFARLLGRAR